MLVFLSYRSVFGCKDTQLFNTNQRNSEYIRREMRQIIITFALMEMDKQLNEVLETIGKNVVERRKALNQTQEDLAFSADIDRTYIGYIENGKQNVTVSVLCRLANALDINIKDLFEDDKPRSN